MNSELIALIEGAAPTLATALAGPLAGAAVQAVADAVGAPHGADVADISKLAAGLHPDVLRNAISAADANFAKAVSSIAPAPSGAPVSTAPLQDATTKAFTNAGITNPTVIMVGNFAITLLGGLLIHRGWVSSDMLVTLIGFTGTGIAIAASAYHSVASNHNTTVLENSTHPTSS